jgi:flagellar hook protein FlgE
MVYDRTKSGSNCAPEAITATPGLRSGLLLMLLMALSVQASYIDLPTGMPWSVAINGAGYLIVRDPATGLETATRQGYLTLDTDGFLVNFAGLRVQGFSNAALSTIGDLQINGTGWPGTNSPPPTLATFEIQSNGCVVARMSDSSSFVRCQILLQMFQEPSALTQIWDNMFVWSGTAAPLPPAIPPGTSGAGTLLSGYVEELVPELQLSVYAGPPDTSSQGFLVSTGLPVDVGIEGGGFFVLRRTNDSALFATRAGAFYLDGSGYLVHYSGMRLQGYTNSALTSIGDVQIDPMGTLVSNNPVLVVADFGISALGVVTEGVSDGTAFVRGQVLLQGCSDPDLLTRAAFDLSPIVTNSGLWSPIGAPFTASLGWLAQGALELNQFDTNLLQARSNLILNFFEQGAPLFTDTPASLYIWGPGFFTVRDPEASILYATRVGAFQLDAIGHLVTTNGLRVQGLNNVDLTEVGDITIDAGDADPTATVTNFSIDLQGNIQVALSDGSQYLRGQVVVQDYRNIQGLSPAGNGLYSNLTAALPVFTNLPADYIPENTFESGAVEQPYTVPLLQLPPESGFRLYISNYDGGTLESSGDLLNWSPVGPINSSVMNDAEFFDTTPSTQKFYRVVLPTWNAPTNVQPLVPVVLPRL